MQGKHVDVEKKKRKNTEKDETPKKWGIKSAVQSIKMRSNTITLYHIIHTIVQQ